MGSTRPFPGWKPNARALIIHLALTILCGRLLVGTVSAINTLWTFGSPSLAPYAPRFTSLASYTECILGATSIPNYTSTPTAESPTPTTWFHPTTTSTGLGVLPTGRNVPSRGSTAYVAHQVAELGRTLYDVAGDGNCMYRALAHQLFQDETRHGEVRSRIADELDLNSHLYIPYFTSDEDLGTRDAVDRMQRYVDEDDFAGYVTMMREDGVWGGQLELAAAAAAFDVDIRIIDNSGVRPASIDDAPAVAPDDALYVALRSRHYYSVPLRHDDDQSEDDEVVQAPQGRIKTAPTSRTRNTAPEVDDEVPDDERVAGYAASTRVLRGDGRIVELGNVEIGDTLFGSDGLPHRVLKITSTVAPVYRLDFWRGGTTPLLCTPDTTLSLMGTHKRSPNIVGEEGEDHIIAFQRRFESTFGQLPVRLTQEDEVDEAPVRRTYPLGSIGGTMTFTRALRYAMQYSLFAERPHGAARAHLKSQLQGLGNIQAQKFSFQVTQQSQTSTKYPAGSKHFIFDDRCVGKASGPYNNERFDTCEEAFEAAKAFSRALSLDTKIVGVFSDLEAALDAKEPKLRRNTVEMRVDSAFPNVYLQRNTLSGRQFVNAQIYGQHPFFRSIEFEGRAEVRGGDMVSSEGLLGDASAYELDNHLSDNVIHRTLEAFITDRGQYERGLRLAGGIDLPAQPITVNPYFLGLWLGDGYRRTTTIANYHEREIIEFLRYYADTLDHALSYYGGVNYRIVRKQKIDRPFPELRGPEGRDPERPAIRPTRKTIRERREARGWTFVKGTKGRTSTWRLPSGEVWKGVWHGDEKTDSATDPINLDTLEAMLSERLADEDADDEYIDSQNVNKVDENAATADEEEVEDSRVPIRRSRRLACLAPADVEGGGLGDDEIEELAEDLAADAAEDQEGGRASKSNANLLLRMLRDLNLLASPGRGPTTDNKHIPASYMFNTRPIRLAVLAGLIDSDGTLDYVGNSYYIRQVANWHAQVIEDVAVLARSCGFNARIFTTRHKGGFRKKWNYDRIVQITGERLHEVPCLLGRKHASKPFRDHRRRVQFDADENGGTCPVVSLQLADANDFLREDRLVLLGSNRAIKSRAEHIRDEIEEIHRSILMGKVKGDKESVMEELEELVNELVYALDDEQTQDREGQEDEQGEDQSDHGSDV